MISDCTGLILTGGKSSRMGQDKARLMLNGATLLQRAIRIMQPLFVDLLVSSRQIRTDCDWQQVIDNPAHAGPLAGLVAGLERATTTWVCVVACDMPYLNASLLEHLSTFRDGMDAVVPVIKGYPQPLTAFYSKQCLMPALELLNSNCSHSLRALLDQLTVRYLDETHLQGFDLQSFSDLDTPEDVVLAGFST
jgi:molybdopterin-guanine dinucleotide biosynthesis protein A